MVNGEKIAMKCDIFASLSLSLFIQFWNSDHVPDYFNFKEFSYQHEFDDAD